MRAFAGSALHKNNMGPLPTNYKWDKWSHISVLHWGLSVYAHTVKPSGVLYGNTIGFGYWHKAAHLVLTERERLLQVPHRQELYFLPHPRTKRHALNSFFLLEALRDFGRPTTSHEKKRCSTACVRSGYGVKINWVLTDNIALLRMSP